jgi:phosphoglycolate phosphatase
VTVALVFDLDGTLAETRHDIAASANHALRSVGLDPIPEDVVTSHVGEGAARLIEKCLGPRQELFRRCFDAWAIHYNRHLLDSTRLFPGAAEALAELPGPLAVLSNKPEGMSRRILDGLGVAGRFALIAGGDTFPSKKPDPVGYRTVLKKVGCARGILIGDSRIDAETARAADSTFWGVTWGFGGGREALVAAGAAEVFDSFGEIVEKARAR